jgi:predicted DNA-binding antitoxin AbrB/MazE fold protein
MTLTVEATYENGCLKLAQPLPLPEHEKVTITVHTGSNWVERTAGLIPCSDRRLIEWAALDPELEYPPPPEAP